MATSIVESPTSTPENQTLIKPTGTGTTSSAPGTASDPFSGDIQSNWSRYWNEDQGTGNFRTNSYSADDPLSGSQKQTNERSIWGNVVGNYSAPVGNYFNAFTETADAMDPMEVTSANAANATKNDRSVTDSELSSVQLNDILSQDNPLMMLAKQAGIDYSQRRGGANSSLAAGASMAEMAKQATPLALQQSEAYRAAMEQNQQLESARRDANANRQQQTNLFNADSSNSASQQEFMTEAQRRAQNAEMQTNTNLQNAAMSNDMRAKEASNSLSYALQQLAGDQDYVKQHMASTLSKELADIEGKYKELISNNDSASRVMTSYMDAISGILSNKDMARDEAISRVSDITAGVKDSLNVISAISGLDLSKVMK